MSMYLKNSNEFHYEISSGSLVLVDFYADWCEPCKWLDSILLEVEKRIPVHLSILKVNTDTHLDLSLEFNIKSVPVLIAFRNGKQIWRLNGFLMADELIEKLVSISRETS